MYRPHFCGFYFQSVTTDNISIDDILKKNNELKLKL